MLAPLPSSRFPLLRAGTAALLVAALSSCGGEEPGAPSQAARFLGASTSWHAKLAGYTPGVHKPALVLRVHRYLGRLTRSSGYPRTSKLVR